MTLNEAIEHTEERACGNDQCANDHAQLADWLRELRRARMEIDLLKTLRDGFKADAQKYKADNAKLRELVVRAHECKKNDGCCENCYQDEEWCPIERDMEELGIEVDE